MDQPVLPAKPARRGICLALAALVATAGTLRAEARPSGVLAEHGLVREGFVWMCPAEVELRKHLDAVPVLDRSLRGASQNAEASLGRVNAIVAQLEQARAAHQQIDRVLKQVKLTPTQVTQFTKKRKDLADLIERLSDLVGSSPYEHRDLRRAMIELVDARNSLTVTILAARRLAGVIEETYRRLKHDPEIRAALKRAGDQYRLGPVRDYAREVKRLDRYDDVLFSDEVPVYAWRGRFHVSTIVNETTPVPFVLDESGETTWLAASVIQKAGIEVPDDAPTAELNQIADRPVRARRVHVPELRIGEHVFEDVEAYALPPDAEDLGNLLGGKTLAPYQLQVQPSEMALAVSE